MSVDQARWIDRWMDGWIDRYRTQNVSVNHLNSKTTEHQVLKVCDNVAHKMKMGNCSNEVDQMTQLEIIDFVMIIFLYL